LIPSWAKDESIGDKLINARAERITEKMSFKKPFEFQRCFVVADGFYEWQLSGRSRTPFRFTVKDKSFFCMAGLWERWIKPPARSEFEFNDLVETPPSRVIETFSIITTTANPMVSAVHERMPVILDSSYWQWWIDDRRRGEDVKFLLRPFDAEDMDCYRGSLLVNNAMNDSPDCLTPA
jgi:putative SOS response-associated peptidase YedK